MHEKKYTRHMYFRWLLCVVVVVRMASAEPRFRRLIVPGPIVSINKYPFAVAMLTCNEGQGGSMLCAQFCSGSLVAPDVVLTAGHCVHSASSAYGTSSPPVKLSTMYALLGTDSPRNTSDSHRKLVKVSSVVNKGYSLNSRYTIDEDIGLAFLDECVTVEAGFIETIKMATMDREPRPGDNSCLAVSSIGFGKTTNLPSPIAYSDGKLRAIDDVVHTFDICSKSYIDLSLELQGYDSSILSDPGNEDIKDFFESFIVPEFTSCHGANTEYSTCSGDSGGPNIATDISGDSIVIGVTSFGVGNFCGYGADYMTRMAPSSWFLSDQMEKNSMKCADTKDSFITWPTRNMTHAEHSSTYLTTRCLGESEWQCASGECISESTVCDRHTDCKDGSDEDSTFCSVAYTKSSSSAKGAPRADITTVHQKETASELETLIAQSQSLIDDQMSEGRRLTTDSSSSSSSSTSSVIVLGTLTDSMGLPSESLLPSMVIDLLPPASERSGPIILDPSVIIRTTGTVPTSCDGTDSTLASMLAIEIAIGQNRAEQNPDSLSSACSDYVYCSHSGNVTTNSTLTTFCNTWDYFVQNRTMAYHVSDNFNTEYNLTCTIATASSPSITEAVPSISTTTVSPVTIANTTSAATTTGEPNTYTSGDAVTSTSNIPMSTSKAAAGVVGGTLFLAYSQMLLIATIFVFCN